MKQRIIISESERKLILRQHSNFANKLVFEQTTNYTIADIKKEINTNYGGKFTSNPYNNKFGPTTAGEIVRALDVVKSKGAPVTSSTPSSTADTTTTTTTTQTGNQGSTAPQGSTTNTDTTGNQGSTAPQGSTTTTTQTGNQGSTAPQGSTTTTTQTGNQGSSGQEDPANGD